MREHQEPRALGPDYGLVIGAFDGLHRGHQALLRCAARGRSRLALVTFDPHPAEVLVPERAPARLQSAAQRARICAALGVDDLVTLPFNAEVAQTTPTAFVQHYLVQGLKPGRVVVGEDFRYGKAAGGDAESLGTELRAAGIEFEALAQQNDAQGHKLGSSEVRAHVRAGAVDEAARILGYLYAVSGKVQHGAARGRKLGFRTANLRPRAMLPAPGVYAGWAQVHRPGEAAPHPRAAVANVGHNPTFDDTRELGIEVHFIGQELGDSLYGEEVEFSFVSRLRDERRFEGVDSLRAAIASDVSTARTLLAAAVPSDVRPPPVVRAPLR